MNFSKIETPCIYIYILISVSDQPTVWWIPLLYLGDVPRKNKERKHVRSVNERLLELLVVLILVVIFNLNRVEQVAIVEILQSGEKNDIA